MDVARAKQKWRGQLSILTFSPGSNSTQLFGNFWWLLFLRLPAWALHDLVCAIRTFSPHPSCYLHQISTLTTPSNKLIRECFSPSTFTARAMWAEIGGVSDRENPHPGWCVVFPSGGATIDDFCYQLTSDGTTETFLRTLKLRFHLSEMRIWP